MKSQNNIAALAIRYVNSTNQNIFLTGKAGTGKTTLLKEIVENTSKNTIVAAPTGIAAINAGGVTLHSLLQLPFGTFIPENVALTDSQIAINTPQTLFKERRVNATKRKILQELELLIIDEVSMLRADLLDCIDTVLRNVRWQKREPFGGVQILFIGDLLQLPPVVKEEERRLLKKYYNSSYFFEARALNQRPLIKVELQKVYRQSEQKFVDLLNRLRHNEPNQSDRDLLNQYYRPSISEKDSEGHIHLTTHNYKADEINQKRLNGLEGDSKVYDASINGDFPENMYPTIVKLELKIDAQVMFIKNDPSGDGEYFNGKIGVVKSLKGDHIVVRIDDSYDVQVEAHEWENKRYTLNKTTNEIEEKYLGSFKQLPVKLAWAVTIHKSQGLTFEKAILDLSQAFASGQLYVALSRLTSLEGLILSSPLPGSPPPIDRELQTYTNTKIDETQLQQQLNRHEKEFIRKACLNAFDFNSLLRSVNHHLEDFNKSENRSIKQHYLSWTEELKKELVELKTVGDKFSNQLQSIINTQNYLMPLNDRISKATDYFLPKINELAAKIVTHLSQLKEKKKVKTYIKEVEEIQLAIINQAKQVVKANLLVSHTSKGEIFTKQHLEQSNLYHSIFANLPKTSKKSKIPTASISFDLYKQGKSITEIAEERGFVTSTIEGHLSQYIASGDIEITELLAEEKLKEINDCYKKGNHKSSEIREALNNRYTYSEIKLALAHITKGDN